MKLFTKTIFFFISLILLEAFLSVILIINIVKKNNFESAKYELSEEATTTYDNYNSWKRNIWKKIIALKNNPAIIRDLNNYSLNNKWLLLRDLQSMYVRSGIDLIVIHDNKTNSYDMLPLTLNTFSISDVSHFIAKKPHPYIDVVQLTNIIAMIGVVPMYSAHTPRFNIFLLKRIDKTFCKQLSLNRRSHAAFFIDNNYFLGPSKKTITQIGFNPSKIQSAYTLLYNITVNQVSYNIAFQKLEPFTQLKNTSDQSLFLATFVSNELYNQQLSLIKNTTIYVATGLTLLTIFLSFFFSRNITNPIKNLLNAMNQIKKGRYTTYLKTRGNNEITELCKRFNEMSKTLDQNKRTMQNYINEITILNDYNEKILHSLHAGIVIVNENLTIEKVNRYFLTTFSIEENILLNKKIDTLPLPIFDKDLSIVIQDTLNGNNREISRIKRLENASVFEIKVYPLYKHFTSKPIISGCIIVTEDISKKVELEEKIFQAEKLSSLSMLSAGMAHEINNPLSSIMSNVQNLIDDESDSYKREALSLIEQETRRIAKIIRELLSFSSKKSQSLKEADINQVLQQVIKLIHYSVEKEHRIKIVVSPSPSIPPAHINQDELKQIFINLLSNAIQAIQGRGIIRIQTYFNRATRTVTISIKDNGVGIPKQNLQNIFDPFFTTKTNGNGTGLGLSVVYGIVKKYNGDIKITSSEGRGTQVSVLLPTLQI